MAFNAATQWEFNSATGLNTNGGGWYNAGGSSADYPAAGTVYVYDDIVIGADNTTATSVDRPFEAADVGNIINVTGGVDFTVQRIQIITVALGVATCDAGKTWGTALATGGIGRLGGALAVPTDTTGALIELPVAGNTIWFRTTGDTGDTFTLTENITAAVVGTVAAPITINSYRTTRGEQLLGTQRPTIAATTFLFWVNAYWNVKNIILTTACTNSGIYSAGANNLFVNVKVNLSTASANKYAFQFSSSYATMVRCEAQCANGHGVAFGIGCTMIDCYIHDCGGTGAILAGANCTFVRNIFDTCLTGIDLVSFDYNNIIGNTIYHAAGTTAIAGTTSNGNRIYGNIISAFTDGVKITTSYLDQYSDFNDYYGNTDDIDAATGSTLGPNDIDVDPGFVDAPGGNFSVGENVKLSDDMTKRGAVGTSTWFMGGMQTPDFPTAANVRSIDTTNGTAGTIATQTLSAANETVGAGYYAATTLSAVDADLAAANISVGKTIFGFVGAAAGGGGAIGLDKMGAL